MTRKYPKAFCDVLWNTVHTFWINTSSITGGINFAECPPRYTKQIQPLRTLLSSLGKNVDVSGYGLRITSHEIVFQQDHIFDC